MVIIYKIDMWLNNHVSFIGGHDPDNKGKPKPKPGPKPKPKPGPKPTGKDPKATKPSKHCYVITEVFTSDVSIVLTVVSTVIQMVIQMGLEKKR